MNTLDPIIEIYSEADCSMGDYDRITLDTDGTWCWEHNEYYPEYYVGLDAAEKVRTDTVKWNDHIPPNFPDYIDPEDPIHGEIVNSLCWQASASSYQELMELTNDEIEHINNVTLRLEGEVVSTFFSLTAFVNPLKAKFSPYRQLNCEIRKIAIKPIEGYIHWLSVGYHINDLRVHVLYPKKARGRITVIVYICDEIHHVKWIHGAGGLFSQEVAPMIYKRAYFPRNKEIERFKTAVETLIAVRKAVDISADAGHE